MAGPLDNPFRSLSDTGGNAPARAWQGAGLLAGIGGAALVRILLEQVRRRVSSRGDAPLNPADERQGWLPALAWAAFIAVCGALGRLLSQRALAALWQRRTRRSVRSMPSA